MDEVFSADEIERMTGEINAQMQELMATEPAAMRGKAGPGAQRQRAAIAQATQQDAGTFLERFRAAARQDLCEQGGILYAQWKKYKDLASKDMLKTFGGILVGMGLAGSTLSTVAVAVSVYVLYLGVEAFCAGKD